MQNKGSLTFYENHPLSLVSTFGIGGKARVFVLPHDISAVADLISMASAFGRYAVIGNASNLLFDDCGFNGTVISTVKMRGIRALDNPKNKAESCIKSMAGEKSVFCALCGTTLPALCAYALKNELIGFEGLCSIPATVGGAICLNAGAYGAEISDNLLAYEVLVPSRRTVLLKIADKSLFLHRQSPVHKTDEIVLSAYFCASKGNADEIKAKMDKNKELRKALQPIGARSAGSYFKRPSENAGRGIYQGKSAGQIIDMCGLKGLAVGGAQVSKKHGNFLINATGDATARDVLRLARQVKSKVYSRTGVALQEEVEFLGSQGKI